MVISLSGEWDIYRRAELHDRLAPAYYERNVILDLTAAKYVTSTLMGALVALHKHRHAERLKPAVLAVRSAFVRHLLAATGIEMLYPIYETVEEALAPVAARRLPP